MSCTFCVPLLCLENHLACSRFIKFLIPGSLPAMLQQAWTLWNIFWNSHPYTIVLCVACGTWGAKALAISWFALWLRAPLRRPALRKQIPKTPYANPHATSILDFTPPVCSFSFQLYVCVLNQVWMLAINMLDTYLPKTSIICSSVMPVTDSDCTHLAHLKIFRFESLVAAWQEARIAQVPASWVFVLICLS